MACAVITREEEVDTVVGELREEPEIAVDIEGDGLFRYRSRLCTVQVGTADRVLIFDTLATDPRRLAPLLGPDGPRKVVHDLSFDARLLLEHGVTLGRVFDTAVAARFLGEQSTGLGSMIEKHFGIVLEKEQQQADWGKRPLRAEAIEYLASDVLHLLPLAHHLEVEVHRADIAEEVHEETDYLLRRALMDAPDGRPPWLRVKGREELSETGLAILRELAAIREEAARRKDVPPFKILGNRQLLEIARRRPRTPAELAAIRGAVSGRARALSGRLLEGVRRGESAGAVPVEERDFGRVEPPPPEEREARKRRHRALSKWRQETAQAREVDAQVVLPGHCLADLTARGAESLEDLRAIPGFGEVRVKRYGADLLSLLGRAAGHMLAR